MDLSFVFWWQLHIVTILLCQVSVGIVGAGECLALKFYRAKGKDVVLTVHESQSVVLYQRSIVCSLAAYNVDSVPQQPHEAAFRSKPQQFRYRAPRVQVLLVQYAVGLAEPLGYKAAHFAGDVGIVCHRKHIYVYSLVVILVEVIAKLYEERVFVTHFHVGREVGRCVLLSLQ